MTPFDSLPMVNSYYRPTVVSKMHRFRMATYWSKIAEKHSHLARSLGATPCDYFDESYLARNYIESWGYQIVYISRSCFLSARHNTCVTDGQTCRRRKDRAMHSVARVKSNFIDIKFYFGCVYSTGTRTQIHAAIVREPSRRRRSV